MLTRYRLVGTIWVEEIAMVNSEKAKGSRHVGSQLRPSPVPASLDYPHNTSNLLYSSRKPYLNSELVICLLARPQRRSKKKERKKEKKERKKQKKELDSQCPELRVPI